MSVRLSVHLSVHPSVGLSQHVAVSILEQSQRQLSTSCQAFLGQLSDNCQATAKPARQPSEIRQVFIKIVPIGLKAFSVQISFYNNVPIVATGKFVYVGAATHDANFANKGENVCHPKNCHR